MYQAMDTINIKLQAIPLTEIITSLQHVCTESSNSRQPGEEQAYPTFNPRPEQHLNAHLFNKPVLLTPFIITKKSSHCMMKILAIVTNTHTAPMAMDVPIYFLHHTILYQLQGKV